MHKYRTEEQPSDLTVAFSDRDNLRKKLAAGRLQDLADAEALAATGSWMSDAVLRHVEIVPDGKPEESAVSGKLRDNSTPRSRWRRRPSCRGG